MQKIGMIRGVDSFGRVVLPMGLRRRLRLKGKDKVRIWMENQCLVIERVKQSCVFCGEDAGVLTAFGNHFICTACVDKIKKI